jgi:thymidylate synthase
MQNVSDIRIELYNKLINQEFVTDKTGVKTVEIMNASFIADEPAIFGTVNQEYVERELSWYKSMSLNVNDIPTPVPAIWKAVATPEGLINSNYGWCIYSEENGNQYAKVLGQLLSNPDSRRAVMIYNRPSMHDDYNKDGMSDFMCTNAVQYLYRDGKLNALVYMRSNDAVFGYKNDYAWQKYVLDQLCDALNIPVGTIYWNVASLHVYERHFDLIKDRIYGEGA